MISPLTVIALLTLAAAGPVNPRAEAKPARPQIRTLGTIDLDMVETTPVVFHDRLLALLDQYVRPLVVRSAAPVASRA